MNINTNTGCFNIKTLLTLLEHPVAIEKAQKSTNCSYGKWRLLSRVDDVETSKRKPTTIKEASSSTSSGQQVSTGDLKLFTAIIVASIKSTQRVKILFHFLVPKVEEVPTLRFETLNKKHQEDSMNVV